MVGGFGGMGGGGGGQGGCLVLLTHVGMRVRVRGTHLGVPVRIDEPVLHQAEAGGVGKKRLRVRVVVVDWVWREGEWWGCGGVVSLGGWK